MIECHIYFMFKGSSFTGVMVPFILVGAELSLLFYFFYHCQLSTSLIHLLSLGAQRLLLNSEEAEGLHL